MDEDLFERAAKAMRENARLRRKLLDTQKQVQSEVELFHESLGHSSFMAKQSRTRLHLRQRLWQEHPDPRIRKHSSEDE